MKLWQRFDRSAAMASRWRRRAVCTLLVADDTRTVAMRNIDGSGATLDMTNPPALGSQAEFRHPHAGSIPGRITEIGEASVRISFDRSEAAIAFALAAVAADMTFDG